MCLVGPYIQPEDNNLFKLDYLAAALAIAICKSLPGTDRHPSSQSEVLYAYRPLAAACSQQNKKNTQPASDPPCPVRVRLSRPSTITSPNRPPSNSSQCPSAIISDSSKASSNIMSASAIASQIQYQTAFANKKQHHSKPQHEGGNPASSINDINKPEFAIGKANLEDPFRFDDEKHLVNACYNNSNNSDKSDQDAMDNESVYSTPVGQSKTAPPAADTPIPYIDPIDYRAPGPAATQKASNSPSKQIDDYDKIVQVIHDHITRELPPLQQHHHQHQDSQSLERQGEETACDHRGEAAEESASAVPEEGTPRGVDEPAAAAEEKTVAAEPENEPKGKEEKDEGDDTVIVTPKVATESIAETAKAEEKTEEKATEDKAEEKTEQAEKEGEEKKEA
ncbi:hypothetical protein BST61_g8566 [Cercospora zeina]